MKGKLPAEMFAEIGLALYGKRWMRPMALALRVDPDTVKRWMGRRQDKRAGLPDNHTAFNLVDDLVAKRIYELMAVRDELARWRRQK